MSWHDDVWLKHYDNLFSLTHFCQFQFKELELTSDEIRSQTNVEKEAVQEINLFNLNLFPSISNNISSRMNHFWIFTSSRALNVFHGNHIINRDCSSLPACFYYICGLYFLIRKSLKSLLIKRVFCVRWKIDPNQNTITLELRACVCLW